MANPWIKVFFFAYLVLGLLILPDYGITMDEPIQRKHGMVAFEYVNEIFNLFPTISKVTGENLSTYDHRDYGMFFQVIAYSLELMLGIDNSRDVFRLRHVMVFCLFWLGLLYFYKALLIRYKNNGLAFAGILLIILSPRIFGDSFTNPKDIPLLSWFMISIFTSINLVNNRNTKSIIAHALISALAIGSRIVGVLIPVVTIIWIIVEFLFQRQDRKWKEPILAISSYVILVMLFTFILWPVLWESPIDSFLHSFRSMKKFRWSGSMLYMGEMIHSSSIPWHYIPIWIVVTTPIAISGLFLVGISRTTKEIVYRPTSFLNDKTNRTDISICLFFFAPLLSVIIFNSVLYNGWRHLYFIYPAMVWISIIGLKELWNYLSRKTGLNWLKYTFIVLISINILEIIHFFIKYHPHQSVYFNILAGDVEKNFERDYYGVSYKKALTLLLEQEKEDTIKIYSEDFIGKINVMNFTKVEAERIKFVDEIVDANYFFSIFNFRTKQEYAMFKNNIFPYNQAKAITIFIKDYPAIEVYKLKKIQHHNK
ncbi:hypothetical protein JYB64_01635 [Algoriphagus aestuarii]|nr:hypothetical protein [Algoriphagus aestuarii]